MKSKKKAHLASRKSAACLLQKASNQSTYKARLYKWKNKLLEKADDWGTPLKNWDELDIAAVLREWADDDYRVKKVRNVTIEEKLRETKWVLIQEGNRNLQNPDVIGKLSLLVSQWTKDRCKTGLNPIPQQAIILSVLEIKAITRRLRFTFHFSMHKQRLNDVRILTLLFTTASGCRTKDVSHLLPQDANLFETENFKVLEFNLRYSKSNRRGDRPLKISLLENKSSPLLCPVRFWLEFTSRYSLQKNLSIWQHPDCKDLPVEKMTTKQIEARCYSSRSMSDGWNQAAYAEGLTRIAGFIGCHSPRNSNINLGFSLTNQDSILQATGKWKQPNMLDTYMQNVLTKPDGPMAMYSTMSAGEIDKLNNHLYIHNKKKLDK